MKLQYLPRVTARVAEPLTKEKFYELIRSDQIELNTRIGRQCLAEGNKEGYQKAKSLLPAVQWIGYDAEGKGRRNADALTPTQLFMIDIDHMTIDPLKAWEEIERSINEKPDVYVKVIAHVTPSGKGLRLILRATQDFPTLKEHMDWLVEELSLTAYGDYDECCKDFSRLSFLVPERDFLYIDESIFNDDDNDNDDDDRNVNDFKPITHAYGEQQETTDNGAGSDSAQRDGADYDGDCEESDNAGNDADEYKYRGHTIREIAAKYVEVYGKPEDGERHNFYNQMVSYFRHICNNDPQILLASLPRFGHSEAECRSQCQSICKKNTVSSIPRPFFLFLLNNGFYPRKKQGEVTVSELESYLADESESVTEPMPTLPPVFREFVACAPKDFILPTINALMPIMGTLTSYLRARSYDGSECTTSFFNVIYAPAGSGKSFATKIVDRLFHLTMARDEIANMREQIFLNAKSGKSANEKDPKDPHVSVRIMPAINSQPEFLQKMRDNKGYHMFTFAEEVDTFNKGTKAGASDKSDMYRIAWDNGMYGQSFKSASTFKGQVRLYYNILLTGTPKQVKKYYNDVENGMVTRVCFCEIENQDFAARPVWKQMNKKQREVVDKFIERCDAMTYMERLDFSVEEAYAVDDKDFDKEVPWQYTYRPFTQVDISWITKDLDAWSEKQLLEASKSRSMAHDTFRRRTAKKGERLALLCMSLWAKVTDKEKRTIRDFVLWWMNQDLRQSLRLFEEKYNKEMNEAVNISKTQPSLFDSLGQTFNKADVIAKCGQLGIRSRVRNIVTRWKAAGLIEKISQSVWSKKA